MKKYLITGYSGFVSRHFLEYLDKNNILKQIGPDKGGHWEIIK